VQASGAAEQEGRREWRLLWLGSIQAFADAYTQKTRWPAATKANPRFSFVDCMSGYFDEAYMREPDAYDRRLAAGQVTSAEVAAVSKFHSLAESYESPTSDDWNSEAILRHPEWQKVVAAAGDAQQRLLALLTDDAEKKALTTPLYGQRQVDAEPVGSSAVGAQGGCSTQNRGHFDLRLFVFAKPVSSSTEHIPSELRRQLLPMGFRAKKTQSGFIFTKPSFAFGRDTRMFAGFSHATLVQERGSWILRLRLDPVLWFAFLIPPVALLLTKPISSVGIADALKMYAMIMGIVAASLVWARIRISRWWNAL
jgi:hypothetical protein